MQLQKQITTEYDLKGGQQLVIAGGGKDKRIVRKDHNAAFVLRVCQERANCDRYSQFYDWAGGEVGEDQKWAAVWDKADNE